MRPACLALLLCLGCDAPGGRAPAPVPAELLTVEGRVVDQDGHGLAEVWVRLVDTTRLSGHVDAQGCGTYHPQQSVPTDAEGRFTASLPFQPNQVEVSGGGTWLEFPAGLRPVAAGAPIVIVGRAIPHRRWSGQIVDAEGAPVPKARVQPEQGIGGVADELGRFEAEAPEPFSGGFRVRRMGYRPLVVRGDRLDRVVLERRPMITVTVLEPGGPPVTRLLGVALWQHDERLSFCTVGEAHLTHEPLNGVCALDAEPGEVELRLEGQVLRTLTVGEAPLAVTVTAPPPR